MADTFAFRTFAALLILIALLAGCNSSSQAAPQAIETYLQALVARDETRLSNVSCKEWEEQARLEFDSFAAVKLALNDLECRISGQDAAYTLVSCTGSITANYGAEDLEINVADRTYLAIQESGEWRMCGYR